MAALIPDKILFVLVCFTLSLLIKMKNAISGTSIAAYMLRKPNWVRQYNDSIPKNSPQTSIYCLVLNWHPARPYIIVRLTKA